MSNFGQVHSLCVRVRVTNDYLAVDTVGYIRSNCLRALTANGWMIPREVEIVFN